MAIKVSRHAVSFPLDQVNIMSCHVELVENRRELLSEKRRWCSYRVIQDKTLCWGKALEVFGSTSLTSLRSLNSLPNLGSARMSLSLTDCKISRPPHRFTFLT